MLNIQFITKVNEEVNVIGQAGDTLMSVAVANGIEGIDAECGGACACATCHVHIAPLWMNKIGPAKEYEADMLALEGNVDEFSRLACQITLADDMNGLVVKVSP